MIRANHVEKRQSNLDMRQAVVERLTMLCDERNIAINKLARTAAVPPSTLKNIMNGVSKNPGTVTIKKLCDGLDITIIDFYNHKLFMDLEQEIK